MFMEKIEYLRKNGRTKGRKKGVMFCGVHPSDDQSVIVGFSLCNAMDDFDVVRGEKKPGFGLKMAKNRALTWSDHTDFFIQNSWTEEELSNPEMPLVRVINPNKVRNREGNPMFEEMVVEIPPSVVDRLIVFLERCRRYYKDKDFPIWCNKLELDEEFDKIRYIEEIRSGERYPACINEKGEMVFGPYLDSIEPEDIEDLDDIEAIDIEPHVEMHGNTEETE